MSLISKFGVVLGIILFISGNNLVSSQWQEHPINCYNCEGSNCTSQLGAFSICEGDTQQSCVTVFSEDAENVIARGCSNNINATHASYCAKNSDKCISCDSNGCNVAKAFSEFVTCVSCDSRTDKNCVIDPKSITNTKVCHKSCMVALRARNPSEIHPSYELFRSCLDDKDLDDREICSGGKDRFCKACEGDKCNTDILPDNRSKCYKCYGDCEDPKPETCIDYNDEEQCYFKFDEEKDIIKMGCRSELEENELIAQVKSKNLLLCSGSECNFFDNLPQDSNCKVCDSETDENCAVDAGKITKSVACSMPYSHCYSMVKDGRTIRGCITELSDEKFYECLTNSTKECHSCSGGSCNEQVFDNAPTGRFSGDLGIWQDLPINCFSCDGQHCATSNGLIKKCQDNDLQTCSTVFSQHGKVIARGCSDEIAQGYGTYCENNPSDCFQCKSSGCNNAVNREDYIDCIFCNSNTNVNCTFDIENVVETRKCHKSCMTALYPRTLDSDPSYNLVRSCLDDKDLDDRENCSSDSYCQSCSDSSLCNTQMIPEGKRHICQHCSGETCQIPTVKSCQSYTSHEQCFIKFEDSMTVSDMGCKSDFDPPEINLLLLAKRLYLCDEDNCNKFDNLPTEHSCRLCNSRTDKFCATEPQNVASSTKCSQLPITSCYSRLLSDGHTERGCLSSLSDVDFLKCYNNNTIGCSICDDELCNDDIFPSNRLSCHTCNTADDKTCESNPKHSSICHPFTNKETCITVLNNGITYRGCSSELSCNMTDNSSCHICNISNCNVENLKRKSDANPGIWQSLPLNCYTCSGIDCRENSLTRLNMCIGNYNQYCMTVFDLNDTIAKRGCSDVVEKEFKQYCDEFSDKCYNCNSNGCNNASSLNEYIDCIHCDSRTNKNCVQDLSVIGTTRRCNTACMVALLPRSVNETSIFELSRSCLDDKDLDDRESCGSDGSLCKSCTSNNCNNFDVFEDRLQCFSCLNGNCDSPTSRKCAAYSKNDTCYILFDQNSLVHRTGCTSEFNSDDLEENSDKMISCSGQNCNNNSIVPSPQMCYACDSIDDVHCALSPNNVTSVRECNILPNVDCYTKIGTDGTTSRGCVSDLSKVERQACLHGHDSLCLTCLGNKCNEKVFPEDRLSCHKCNSLDDPNCQDKPNSPTICSVYSDDEVCSSKLVDGVTYRGCGNDFTCDESDKQYCKMCNSSNCNVANLYQNNIGYPGTWQDLPINCYTCNDAECENNSTTKLRKCENNNLQNCVTVFNMAGTVVQRGCSEAIYAGNYDHHCDQNPDLCTYCKSSGCNDAKKLDEYNDCLFCDSTMNSNCTANLAGVSKTRKCKDGCMTALYPKSDETNPAFELTRSCLDDKDPDDRAECQKEGNPLCKACQGDKCNKDMLPEKRLSCNRCDDSDSCEDPVAAICPAYRDNDTCYILFDDENNIAKMGCKSDFDNLTLNLLRKKMIFCDNGDNCNTFDLIPMPHKCLVCSSEEDPRCATKPDSMVNLTTCTNMPYTSCFSRISADGHTIRGCLADLEMDTIDKCLGTGDDILCKICDSEGCNSKLYPENRQSCHRCSTADDKYCQSEPSDTSACPIYQEDDQCVVTIFGNTTNRGCSSELGCNANDRETCRICPSNNCNTVDLMTNYIGKPGQWQDLPLNCYTCTGDACQTSLGNLKMCENNNLQKCESVYDSVTLQVVRRGCSDDVASTHGDYCDANKGLCQQCKSSGCNKVAQLSEYVDCVFCDTTTNSNCVLDPVGDEGIKSRKCNQRCMVALSPRSSEEDPAYELSRSCLDDKDIDDMQVCIDSKEPHCLACSASGCNIQDFPGDRHECWTCRGDDCDDAKKQKCVSYRQRDQCYTLFDNSSNIIAMGCGSEYEKQTMTSLVQSKALLLCDEKNCNSYESIPEAQSCIVCHSAIDPQCATNPNLIVNSTTCSTLPYTGCYTLVNEDGDTVRGCQSSLESTSFYGCHTQSDEACSTCTGNKCNDKVFPSNRTTCHRCNSQEDEYCAFSPLNTGVCPKYTTNESCVTSYKNGITYRGCLSELSCDPSDKKTCRICSGSACNTVNLEHVANDGEPGKWQDLPLKCKTCKDDTCNQSPLDVEVCSNNNLQNCVVVFDAQDKVIQRGCSDSVEKDQEEYCEQNTGKCFRCNSNECNIATQITDYVRCVSCDTNTNSSCVTSPGSERMRRMCFKGCMTALYPKTMEDDPAYDTVRSCLDDKELLDQQTCQDGNDSLCKSCSANECNTDSLPDDRRKCIRCSGDDCQLPRTELCPGYRKNDQCSLLLDEQNSIIEAGCKSDFTIAQTVTLIKAKRLILCDGDECNKFESLPSSQKCSLCNSRTDPNCATNPGFVAGPVTCNKLPYTQCYTRTLADGATERGCLSSLFDNEFYDCLIGNSTTCQSCTGDNCNKKIYPEGRKSCYICDSDSDPSCHSSPYRQSICPIYSENDTCVTSFTAGATHRGCQSSIQCDSTDRKKCRICSDDNCNTINLERKQDDNFGKWQDLPLECYECTGDACNGSQTKVKKCENNNEQDCSIVYNPEGIPIRRGCSDDVELDQEEYCEANPDLCFNCKSNRCNGEINPSEFNECVYCDSNKNISCVTSPHSIKKTRICTSQCMTALVPSDSSSNPAYDLIRTCLNDKEKEDQNNCTEPLCHSCSGEKCNVNDIPEDRISCHTCLNGNCEDPVSELCPLYKKDDKCFVRFDSSNSIVEMGCLSSFRAQDITNILSTKRVFICNGTDCNQQENLPQAQKCVTCNSLDDVNCAINAPQIGNVQSCNTLPYSHCHTSIAADGSTYRGCLAELPAAEFVSCILSGGENCTHCLGDVCNREVFPPSRLQCYSCNSSIDRACEDIPEKLLSCPFLKDSERCVTALTGNTTIRGCSSQISCDSTDKSTCRHCSSTGCNTVNLINRKNDTNHGMWQELPLRCYNCTGDECQNSLGSSVICAGGDQQDCMTVFAGQLTVSRRGCAYDVEDEFDLYCRMNPDKCISCKSNECNDAWNLAHFDTCAYCNSETDASCATRPEEAESTFETRNCLNGCMAATYTAKNGSTQVIRTCLDDKEILDRPLCAASNSDSNCLSCTGDGCNLFNYPTDRLSCHRCAGDDCSKNEYCAAYVKDDKCYVKYSDGKIELSGCASEHDSSVLQGWRENNQLFDCSDRNCNAPELLPTAQTCVACDSSKNVECATNPSLINGTELCSAPINSCMMRISNSATHRGCLNSLSYNEQTTCGSQSQLCDKCSGEKCNSKIYPSDRRSCYICQSDKHDNCVKEPKAISVCPNYSQSNQCVTKFDGKVTQRGCTTELTCDVSDVKHCQICNESGCNTVQLDGAMTIIANNLLLTILVAIVGLRAVKSQYV